MLITEAFARPANFHRLAACDEFRALNHLHVVYLICLSFF